MKTIFVRILCKDKHFCKWMDFPHFPQIGSFFNVSDDFMVKVSGVLPQSKERTPPCQTLELKPFHCGDLREVLLKYDFWESSIYQMPLHK